MQSAFFQALIRSLEDAIIVADERGVIELVNPAAEQLLGWPARELVGQKLNVLMPAEHAARHDSYLQQYLQTGQAHIIGRDRTVQARHRDGTLIDAMLSVTEVVQDGQRHFVGRLRDIREQLRQRRELEQLAYHDLISGLPNPVALRARLADPARPSAAAALAIVDVEGMRRINDSAGHRVGDWVLQALGQRLRSHAPGTAEVYRWTGDEFVLLLPSAPLLERLPVVVQRWLERATRQPLEVGSHQFRIKLRAGCRTVALPASSPDELMAGTDMALLHAKRTGSVVVDYTQLPHLQRTPVLQLSRSLHEAMRDGSLAIHLQPKVDGQQRIVGAETLLRWQHPDLGLLGPVDIFAAAHTVGMVDDVKLFALQRSLDLAATWADDPALTHLGLAINLSPEQFNCPDLIDHLRQHLQGRSLRRGSVRLEVTEDAVFEGSLHDVQRTVSGLLAMGFELSLDDFGTGHSSLIRLATLPFAEIKIDRQFVARHDHDPTVTIIVSAIANIAQQLSVDLVAEGVETEQQFQAMRSVGCTLYQGFLFGRPMSVDDFVARVRSVTPARGA